MPHLALLGDSIFDNARYTSGAPAVIDHVRRLLPADWTASLHAVDGSTTYEVPKQLKGLPPETTHLVMSIGGNNALLRADVLDSPVRSSGEAMLMLCDVAEEFEDSYRRLLRTCLRLGYPLVVCTVYNCNFPEEGQRRKIAVGLAVYNDGIVRVASELGLTIVELRSVCTVPKDFANALEPSVQGGEKIARALVHAVTTPLGQITGGRIQFGV